MKPIDALKVGHRERRAPHGARGLKHAIELMGYTMISSRPARGAWIETMYSERRCWHHEVAPRTGRVD